MGKQSPRREDVKLYRGRDWPQKLRGFSGINAGGIREYMDPWVAFYCLNITNRTGLFGASYGPLVTRNGFGDRCNWGFPSYSPGSASTTTVNPVRMLHKAYLNKAITENGEMCRIVSDRFQVDDGSGPSFVEVDPTVRFNKTTSYPQSLETGWPDDNLLLIAYPGTVANPGGLYAYDGTSFWNQIIPRFGGVGNVNSLRWIAQDGSGRVYVCGDWIDPDMPLTFLYSKPGAIGTAADPTNVDNWAYPFGGGNPVYAKGPRRQSGPTRTTGMAWLDGYIVIFTQTGRYIISNPGTGNETIDYETGCGCISGNLIAEHPLGDKIYWWNFQGCYEWNGAGNPVKISDPVWPLLGNVRFKNADGDFIAQRFFSFFFMNQFWTCLRTSGLQGISGDELNTNFVLDMTTRQWYLNNLPMTAAAVADSGNDIERLYFADPTNHGTVPSPVYRCNRFGVDDTTGLPIYADNVTGDDRDGEDIQSIWKVRITGDDYLQEKYADQLRVGGIEIGAGPAYTQARILVYPDGNGPYTLTWPTAPDDEVHEFNIGGRKNNYLDLELDILGQRQTIIKAAELTYRDNPADG